jgi:hypothetical protein
MIGNERQTQRLARAGWVAYIQATLNSDKALVGQPLRNLIVWPAIRGQARHQHSMAEWDFA